MTTEPPVSIFVCRMLHWETLGMAPCPRCGQLTYVEHEVGCDVPPHEQARYEAERYSPDVRSEEVAVMLDDRGLVDYVDPLELYGEGREEALLTGLFDVLDGWVTP